jgi:glutaredoxin 3
MIVEIYSRPNCGYCTMAKQLATAKGCEVKYYNLGVDFGTKEMFELFPGARTFPQIILDGEKIGGYTELEKILNASTT